mmetsp:Transcript_58384/g.164873  ORF Transcript_58384/g.164873 Transcript_58384/m.164873 type:complete len:228 (+) Transcript_58384:134-817(+)
MGRGESDADTPLFDVVLPDHLTNYPVQLGLRQAPGLHLRSLREAQVQLRHQVHESCGRPLVFKCGGHGPPDVHLEALGGESIRRRQAAPAVAGFRVRVGGADVVIEERPVLPPEGVAVAAGDQHRGQRAERAARLPGLGGEARLGVGHQPRQGARVLPVPAVRRVRQALDTQRQPQEPRERDGLEGPVDGDLLLAEHAGALDPHARRHPRPGRGGARALPLRGAGAA